MDFTHLQTTLQRLWSLITQSCTALSIIWGPLPAHHSHLYPQLSASFAGMQLLLEVRLGAPWGKTLGSSFIPLSHNRLSPFQLHKTWLTLKSLIEYIEALLSKCMTLCSKWGEFPCTAEARFRGDQWSLSQLIQKKDCVDFRIIKELI